MRGRARAPRSARFGPKLSWDTSKGRAVGAGRLDVVDALARSIRVEGDRYAAGELTGDVRAPLSDGHRRAKGGRDVDFKRRAVARNFDQSRFERAPVR